MWKYSFYILASVAIVMLLGSCADRNGQVEASLAEEFSLSIGQSASIGGENLQIRFKEVKEDSRCPKNVNCVWAGRVSLTVEIKQNDSSNSIVLNQPGLTDQYAVETYKEYQFTFNVEPYPQVGMEIATGDYRLLLTVSKNPLQELGSTEGPQMGNLAPDFELQGLEAEIVSLSALQGSPVMLNFWVS